jgi:hypothetical protein
VGRGVQGDGRQVRLVVVLKCGAGIGVVLCGVLQCYVVLRVVWCRVVWCGVSRLMDLFHSAANR